MSPRFTHPDEDLVYACPDCDQAGDVYRRVQDNTCVGGDHEFVCHKCGTGFEREDIVERESRHDPIKAAKMSLATGVDRDTLARKLIEAESEVAD